MSDNENKPMLLTKTSLARELGISRVTLDEILPRLQAHGLKSINIKASTSQRRKTYRYTRQSVEKMISSMEKENE